MHRQKVIATHAQPRDAIAYRLGRERRLFAAGNAVAAGDSPLVICHAQYHRRAIDDGEGEGLVEIAFRARAFAAVTDRDALIVGVPKAAPHIAGQRIEAICARRVEHRQLSSLEGIAGIGIDLVDQIEQRIVARHQPAHHSIGRKADVIASQHQRLRCTDRHLTRGLNVETGLALPMRAEHAFIEPPRQKHRLQSAPQMLRIESGIPGTHGATLIIQYADQTIPSRCPNQIVTDCDRCLT